MIVYDNKLNRLELHQILEGAVTTLNKAQNLGPVKFKGLYNNGSPRFMIRRLLENHGYRVLRIEIENDEIAVKGGNDIICMKAIIYVEKNERGHFELLPGYLGSPDDWTELGNKEVGDLCVRYDSGAENWCKATWISAVRYGEERFLDTRTPIRWSKFGLNTTNSKKMNNVYSNGWDSDYEAISERQMREKDLYDAYGEEYEDNEFDWL